MGPLRPAASATQRSLDAASKARRDGSLPSSLFSQRAVLFPLLLFFSFQACAVAGPIRQYGYGVHVERPVAFTTREGSYRHVGCRGVLDICCHSSLRKPLYGHSSGQVPMVPPSSTVLPFEGSEGSSSTLLGQTMKLLHPFLSLAAGAWCSSTMPSPSPSFPSATSSCAATSYWPGFSGIKYAFTFGDSYTTTDFDYLSPSYPTEDNPLGNPTYPGQTSSNGPNWVDYLTVKYNQSLLRTYNLAVGGASVDLNVLQPYLPTVGSLKDQVLNRFIPGYYEDEAAGAPAWYDSETLFAIWIGINDVQGSYARGPSGPGGTDSLNRKKFAEYAELAEVLYQHSAANFVFINVPALERSPLTAAAGKKAQEMEKADLEAFNGMIVDMARELKRNHEDVNVWVYDTYADFSKVMDDPGSFPQTSGYKNTTDFCEAYQLGTPESDTFEETCGIPANQYLWLNSLHPTDPIHEVVADQVAKLLQAGPNIC